MNNKIVNTRDIVEVGVFMLICYFVLGPTGKILVLLQKKIYGSGDMLYFTEGLFSQSICAAIILILLAIVYVFIFRKDIIQYRKIKLGLIITSVAAVILFILAFFNATVFYGNKIVDYSLSSISGKTYSYKDVKKVTMGKATSTDSKVNIFYDLSMQDGNVLSLRAVPGDMKCINAVEEKIDMSIPHIINKTDYDYMIKQKIALPENFQENFKVTD